MITAMIRPHVRTAVASEICPVCGSLMTKSGCCLLCNNCHRKKKAMVNKFMRRWR